MPGTNYGTIMIFRNLKNNLFFILLLLAFIMNGCIPSANINLAGSNRIRSISVDYVPASFAVDENTLEPIETQLMETIYPKDLDSIRSSFPGMGVNKVFDACKAPEGEHYLLRWETLSPNRDQQRQESLPPNSLLELVRYE
jgi:hypothetical protein